MDLRNIPFVLLLIFVPIASGGCAFLMEDVEQFPTKYKAPTDLYNQALGEYQAGRYAEAGQLLQQYIRENPKSLLYNVALYYLGHCSQMLGDIKEAKVLYSRVIDLSGDDDFWSDQAMKRIRQIEAEQ